MKKVTSKVAHNWPIFTVMPWAANMAKNQKSISEIGHPLLYLLCGCVHMISVKVDALEIERKFILINVLT